MREKGSTATANSSSFSICGTLDTQALALALALALAPARASAWAFGFVPATNRTLSPILTLLLLLLLRPLPTSLGTPLRRRDSMNWLQQEPQIRFQRSFHFRFFAAEPEIVYSPTRPVSGPTPTPTPFGCDRAKRKLAPEIQGDIGCPKSNVTLRSSSSRIEHTF